MKIAVGTISPQKLQYLREILDELHITADLVPIKAASNVSEQPLSDNETKLGSINRTKNAYSKCNDADIALGIEVGYHPDSSDKYEILCYATVIDKNDKQISAESHRFLLPDFHQNILNDNKDLGQYVRQFLDECPDEYSQTIGEDIRSRKPFIKAAIKMVLSEYFS